MQFKEYCKKDNMLAQIRTWLQAVHFELPHRPENILDMSTKKIN